MELTLDELFRWQAPAEVTVKGKTVKVLLRTLGEAAERERRDKALAASRLALRDFDDHDSLLYINRVQPLFELSDDDLRTAVMALQLASFRERAATEIVQYKDESAKPPETLTDIIEQVEQAEDDDTVRRQAEENWVKEAMVSFEQDYDRMTREQRQAEAVRLMRELIAREAFMERWISCTLYRSVYTEDGKRLYYSTLEQWDDADPQFRDRMLGLYLQLDRASQNPNSSSAPL